MEEVQLRHNMFRKYKNNVIRNTQKYNGNKKAKKNISICQKNTSHMLKCQSEHGFFLP